MISRPQNILVRGAAAALIGLGASLPGVALATEGGGTSYPLGAENYMSGAMPPPGFYGQLFVNHYEADNLRGNDGSKLPA